ncbi:MAG: hypothetical protein ACKOX7_00255 [Bacteroidota bacterium]
MPGTFPGADVDLFVIYDHLSQLGDLKKVLPADLNYDIKLLQRDNLKADFVFMPCFIADNFNYVVHPLIGLLFLPTRNLHGAIG